jgi:hypothetical protein
MKNKIVLLLLSAVILLSSCDSSRDNIDGNDSDYIISKNEVDSMKDPNSKSNTQILDYGIKLTELEKKIEMLTEKNSELLSLNKEIENKIEFQRSEIRGLKNLYVQHDLVRTYIDQEMDYTIETGYVKYHDVENNVIGIDIIEWLNGDGEDDDRLEELGINPDSDMPNNFMIYNETEEIQEIQLESFTLYYRIDYNGELYMRNVAESNFVIEEDQYDLLCDIIYLNGKVYQVMESYVP